MLYKIKSTRASLGEHIFVITNKYIVTVFKIIYVYYIKILSILIYQKYCLRLYIFNTPNIQFHLNIRQDE